MHIIVDVLASLFFRILEKAPEWLAVKGIDRLGKRPIPHPSDKGVQLYPDECGEKGVDLEQNRLLVSAAFSTYFAGLLEHDSIFVTLEEQVECPLLTGQEELKPVQRILWALQRPRGPRLLIIAAEGGMGKSTLAAKVVRCLFEEQAVDMILGDSAKTHHVDAVTGEVASTSPVYYDLPTFYRRLCSQLGLPYKHGYASERKALGNIRDRLEGRRAVIVVDNLETVADQDRLLHSLHKLTTRDVRVLITTREVSGLSELSANSMIVRMKPITDLPQAQKFLAWHIRHHQDEYPDLRKLEKDLNDKKCIHKLITRTGGIPLLIQLVFSDIARSSWECLERLPRLFGDDLLVFLYQARWDELGVLGDEGLTARQLLLWIADEQFRGERVSFRRVTEWAEELGKLARIQTTLQLLHERFLIVNHDPKKGNFAIFPSLAEFLQQQCLP